MEPPDCEIDGAFVFLLVVIVAGFSFLLGFCTR